jgi:hypothetical protein
MTTGFGNFDLACPMNEAGHEFANQDDKRPCIHCGTVGRGDGGFLTAATEARCEFFSTLSAPKSAHGTPRKKP